MHFSASYTELSTDYSPIKRSILRVQMKIIQSLNFHCGMRLIALTSIISFLLETHKKLVLSAMLLNYIIRTKQYHL